jgi:hypothetical protein
LPAAAIPRAGRSRILQHNERRASVSEHAWMEGCRPLPHCVESFPDSLAMVGGAHRQACVGHRHTVRSRYWTRPQRWEARTGTAPMGTQPCRRQACGQTAHTTPLLAPAKTRAKKKVGTLPPPPARPRPNCVPNSTAGPHLARLQPAAQPTSHPPGANP